MNKQHVTFLTFSSSDWAGTRIRLRFKAIESGWFDEVHDYDESALSLTDEERNWFDTEEFHGFYFYKPMIILEELKKMNDGDILVYSDAGNDINLNGRQYFYEKLRFLKRYSLVGYAYTKTGNFTKSYIYDKLNIDINNETLNMPQLQCNVLYMKKSKELVNLIRKWKDLMLELHDELKMEFKKEKDLGNEEFLQSRCDQTILNLLCYKNDLTLLINAPMDFILGFTKKSKKDIRLTKLDIVPCRKKFDYKKFVAFSIGHVLPVNEIDYDEYTHFINVSDKDLERCSVHKEGSDTIGELNDLAEMTGIYWIWKNIDLSGIDYISIFTYRKPFINSNDILYNDLSSRKYDCIATKFYQHRYDAHMTSFNEDAINGFRNIFKQFHPNDYVDFCKSQHDNYLYPCNTFIISVKEFYSLCDYLFPMLIEYAKLTKGCHGKTDHSPYSGVFAEDVTSFFLKKTFKNIKSCPLAVFTKHSVYFSGESNLIPTIWGVLDINGRDAFFTEVDLKTATPFMDKPTHIENSKNFYPDYFRPENIRLTLQNKIMMT